MLAPLPSRSRNIQATTLGTGHPGLENFFLSSKCSTRFEASWQHHGHDFSNLYVTAFANARMKQLQGWTQVESVFRRTSMMMMMMMMMMMIMMIMIPCPCRWSIEVTNGKLSWESPTTLFRSAKGHRIKQGHSDCVGWLDDLWFRQRGCRWMGSTGVFSGKISGRNLILRRFQSVFFSAMVRHTYICCWLKFMAAKDSMCQDRFCFFFWGEPHVILGVAKGRAQSKSLWSDFRWLVWLGSTPSGAKAKAMAKRYHKVANSNSSISNLTPGHSAVALLIACNLPFCANKIMHKNDTQWSMAKEYQVCLSQFDSPSSRSSWPISCRSGCWQCLRWERSSLG